VKIYTASRFQSYERTREFNDLLRAAGHEVTYDWTRTDEFGEDGHPRFVDGVGELTYAKRREYAMLDLQGVVVADLTIVFADDQLTGALIEMGAACALGRPVWVLSPWKESIFWALPNVEIMSEVQCYERLGLRAAA
jgi:nucleoside 2-deoxyribosyltransferase